MRGALGRTTPEGRPEVNRFLGLALLAVAMIALSSCGSDASHHRYITYAVKPSEQFLKVSFHDTSDYVHTVWVVVDDPRGRVTKPFSWQAGYDPGMMSVTTGRQVRPGTYRYAVYVADGDLGEYDRQYWTPEYLFDSGEVTVP
jgi:hypothetical protein